MAENNTNRTVMILAGAVVVLLVVFVGVVMLTLNGNTGAQTAQTPGTGAGVPTTGTSMPGIAPSSEFATATATKVPAKQTPGDYVKTYYQAIIDKKWDVAYKMQPAASQTGGAESFGATQESYGIIGFSVFSDNTGADAATVVVRLDLGATNGIWNSTWNFVKVDGNWLVQGRSKIGMGEPTK
jgi:hypothetical protein